MKTFTFDKGSEGARAMAAFVAELERQNINYNVEHDTYKFHITITGY
jgi:hypothetical protein